MFKKNLVLFIAIIFLSEELSASGIFGNFANTVKNLIDAQRQIGEAQKEAVARQQNSSQQPQPQYRVNYLNQQPVAAGGTQVINPQQVPNTFPYPVPTPNAYSALPAPIPDGQVSTQVIPIPNAVAQNSATTSIPSTEGFNVSYDAQNKEFSTASDNIQQYKKVEEPLTGGFPVYYDPQNKDFMTDNTNILPYKITQVPTPTPTPVTSAPPTAITTPVVTTPAPAPVVTTTPSIPSIPTAPPTPMVTPSSAPVTLIPASSQNSKYYNPLDESLVDFTDSRDIFDKKLLPQGSSTSEEGLKPISKIPALGQMLCERCMRGQFANNPEASDECIRQCVVIYRGLFNPDLGKSDQSFPDTPESLSLEKEYKKEHSRALDNPGSDSDNYGDDQQDQQNQGQNGQKRSFSMDNLNPYATVDAPLPRRLPSSALRKRPSSATGGRF